MTSEVTEAKVMYFEVFLKFKDWKILSRTKREGRSSVFLLIMVWNFVQDTLMTIRDMKELQGIIRFIILLNKMSKGKMYQRGEKGIFMGYNDGVKGYQIWSPSERRVIFSRDVTFNEDYLFRVKQDPIELKLKEGVSEMVEDIPKHVEHIVLGDTNHDVTSPNDHTICHIWYIRKISLWFETVIETVAPSGSLIYLLLYVDDMLVVAKDMEEVSKLKILLNIEFDMKDLRVAQMILGRYGISVPALTKDHKGNKIQYAISRRRQYAVFKLYGNKIFWKISNVVPTPRNPPIRRSGTRILRSPDFDLFSDQEEYSEEEVAETMAETMEQYMSKTQADYGSGIARPKIEDNDNANEHIEKVLEIVDLFHIPNITIDQVMLRSFPMSLTGVASQWLRNKPSGLITTWEDLKTKFLRKYCPLARTAKKKQILDSRGAIPSKTAAGAKVAIQEMAEYSQKWYNGTSRTRSTKTSDGLAAIQAQLNNLGREIKEVNEKVYAAQEKIHEENSNLIKEIRALTDAAIRNQGASIKTLEIQIGQMSKVLQERGFGSLPSSTETNPRDHFKSISTIVKADSYPIHPYSEASHINNSIPRKEKDLESFTLPCFINNICFNIALTDLGASVSVMPLSTYLNLRLSELAHTKLTVELADRTVKYPKGIAENVLVGIGKFVFPIDFIILDMPEDIKVPLILRRLFLPTTRAKIDVFKRKITLRVGEEKIIFKSVKPSSSLIKRVYKLGLRERMELDLEARLIGETLVLNRSLDPFFGDYIQLNNLNVPLELRRDQVDDLMPTIEEGEVVEEFRARNDVRMVSKVFGYPSDCDHDKKIRMDCAYNLKFSCMIVSTTQRDKLLSLGT
ncbi:putative reverse transcriptase domain-containing protein [Tanacetum coccineum]